MPHATRTSEALRQCFSEIPKLVENPQIYKDDKEFIIYRSCDKSNLNYVCMENGIFTTIIRQDFGMKW